MSPLVFVSYTQETQEHMANVRALADQLVIHGIKVVLDQYYSTFDEGFELWMERNIEEADFVLLICTDTYRRRVMKEEEKGKGLGATWEGHLIRQRLYQDGSKNSRFLPVLFPDGTPAAIPSPLRGSFPYYLVDPGKMHLSGGTGYEKLYRRLTGQPETIAPILGDVQQLETSQGKATPDEPTEPI
jgi:hypothetical protein